MRTWLAICEMLFVLFLFGLTSSCGGGSSTSPSKPVPASVIATIPVGKFPFVVDVNPATNRVYVVNSDDQPPTVSVIDGATNSVVATVPVGSPCGSAGCFENVSYACIAVNSQTNKIYVGVPGASVTVIDGATNDAITVGVGVGVDQPCWLAVNTSTNQIYVATSGTLTVIDGATNNVVTLTVETEPLDIGVDPVTNVIYVSGRMDAEGNGNVTVISGVTNETTTIPILENSGGAIAVDSVRNKAYVLITHYHGSDVLIIDGATLATTTIPNSGGDALDPTSGGIAVNVTTNKIYVPRESGSVSVIDGMTQSLTTVLAGQEPTAVVIDSAINQIYIPGGGGGFPLSSPGTVTVIDGASNSTTTLGVGISPGGAALNSATHMVYVTNSCGNDLHCAGNGTVSVIEATH